MTQTIYIEKDVRNNLWTKNILSRYKDVDVIDCERYAEVFNPSAQNFRLQKKNPALILAKKHQGFVLACPLGYGVGSELNYYFSHMMNCVYDCRYCFLQGMYRSANYVVFVNYEDFFAQIERTVTQAKIDKPGQTPWFFSGYDCDSLALDAVTGFMAPTLDRFEDLQAFLEIRTKSTQIRSLLKRSAMTNVIVAFSFSASKAYQAFEHKVPSIEKRLIAMKQLQEQGWRLGIRLDPLIFYAEFEADYHALIKLIFSYLDADKIHSVSLGGFRLPKGFYTSIKKLYPDEPLYKQAYELDQGMIGYPKVIEQEMIDCVLKILDQYIDKEKVFVCAEDENNISVKS